MTNRRDGVCFLQVEDTVRGSAYLRGHLSRLAGQKGTDRTPTVIRNGRRSTGRTTMPRIAGQTALQAPQNRFFEPPIGLTFSRPRDATLRDRDASSSTGPPTIFPLTEGNRSRRLPRNLASLISTVPQPRVPQFRLFAHLQFPPTSSLRLSN